MVTEIKGDDSKTIVSLHDWKVKHADLVKQRKAEAEFASLPFQELVEKTQELVQDLKGMPYDLDMARKSLVLLQEIRKRLENEGPFLSQDVAKMIQEITERQNSLA